MVSGLMMIVIVIVIMFTLLWILRFVILTLVFMRTRRGASSTCLAPSSLCLHVPLFPEFPGFIEFPGIPGNGTGFLFPGFPSYHLLENKTKGNQTDTIQTNMNMQIRITYNEIRLDQIIRE